ncbi:hypothetical protein BDR04DRAFT_1087497 [Suillus decipiens]|nr:hypothetical protein BDR04DRAFT_1087497 [Suillus decipiens]
MSSSSRSLCTAFSVNQVLVNPAILAPALSWYILLPMPSRPISFVEPGIKTGRHVYAKIWCPCVKIPLRSQSTVSPPSSPLPLISQLLVIAIRCGPHTSSPMNSTAS